MTFMNEWEIDCAVGRHTAHPVLGPAIRFLSAYRDEVNRKSDGWPYWGHKAADKLMDLISSRDSEPTAEEIRRSIGPIKAFCTKHGLTCPALEAVLGGSARPRVQSMVSCAGCGQSWPRDPALEVECPKCGAPAGRRRKRPSGHECDVHSDRDVLALSLGIIQPCPAATAKAGRKICDSPVSDLPLFGGAR